MKKKEQEIFIVGIVVIAVAYIGMNFSDLSLNALYQPSSAEYLNFNQEHCQSYPCQLTAYLVLSNPNEIVETATLEVTGETQTYCSQYDFGWEYGNTASSSLSHIGKNDYCRSQGYTTYAGNYGLTSDTVDYNTCVRPACQTSSVSGFTLSGTGIQNENAPFSRTVDIADYVNNYCGFGNFERECRIPLTGQASSGGYVKMKLTGFTLQDNIFTPEPEIIQEEENPEVSCEVDPSQIKCEETVTDPNFGGFDVKWILPIAIVLISGLFIIMRRKG